jgi:hypothetical protein
MLFISPFPLTALSVTHRLRTFCFKLKTGAQLYRTIKFYICFPIPLCSVLYNFPEVVELSSSAFSNLVVNLFTSVSSPVTRDFKHLFSVSAFSKFNFKASESDDISDLFFSKSPLRSLTEFSSACSDISRRDKFELCSFKAAFVSLAAANCSVTVKLISRSFRFSSFSSSRSDSMTNFEQFLNFITLSRF